jgi:carbonic anhydrase
MSSDLPSSSIDRLIEANRRYAAARPPAEPWRPTLALILCMDARLDPVQFLGLRYGQAHIIRNAGGRMAEAVRSLAISQAFFGTSEVAVIHHTECGMLGRSEDEMRAAVERERGISVGAVRFLPFPSLEQSIREDMVLYRSTPFLRQDIPVRGFVIDVATGLLEEIW